MASEWYYQNMRQKHGPHTAEELRQLARAGNILPADKVWRHGMEKPVAASRLKGLFDNAPVVKEDVPSDNCSEENHSGSLIPLFHVMLVPLCGVGLFLIFRSPLWSRKAKLIWAGSLLGLLSIGLVVQRVERNAMTVALSESNVLWDDNKKVEAVEKYWGILDRHWKRLNEPDRSKIIQRVVDFDAENLNDPDRSKDLIRRALEDQTFPKFENPLAQALQRAVMADWRQQQQASQNAKPDALAEQKDTATQASSTPIADQRSTRKDSYSVAFDDGEQQGQESGAGANRAIKAILASRTSDQYKRTETFKIAMAWTKSYQVFLATRDDVAATLGENHANTQRFKGLVDGFRTGFNRESRSYQLPRR